MNCTACHRMNLPGGVRCIYCGVTLPAVLDFDLSPSPAASASRTPTSANRQQPARRTGLVGFLVFLALKFKTLFALLKFGKIALTLGSMLVFITAESSLFGWKLAVGFGLCIFVHEMGHVVVNWRKGLKQSAPVFIPFAGAVIFLKNFPDDPTIQSESGAGGPVAGGLAAVVCLLIGLSAHSPFWLALAYLGFFINLFNLIPFPPLDGSHIASVFSPKIWGMVLVALLLWTIKMPGDDGLLWMILIVNFLFSLGRGSERRYLLAAPAVRVRMAVLYVVLCIGLASGAQITRAAGPTIFGGEARSHAAASSARSRAATLNTVQDDDTLARRSSTSATETPQFTAQQVKEMRARAEQKKRFWYIVFLSAFSLIALVLWSGTAGLLTVASKQRFGARSLALIASMLALLVVLFALLRYTHLGAFAILSAYFAAAFAGMVYAIYQAVHLRAHTSRPSLTALTMRCLAWAAGAALLVAYWKENLAIVVLLAVCALIFYAFHRWAPFSLAASLFESLNDHDRAMSLRRRAIDLHPDPPTAIELWNQIANANILLDRGDAALEALDARDALRQTQAPAATAMPRSIAELQQRAAALMLVERYDETLTCCEQILQAPPSDPLSRLRLLAVHLRMARLALFRGWYDEVLAQAETCQKTGVKLVGSLLASNHILRAEALIGQGQAEAARAECDLSRAASREPYHEAAVAVLRARACLLSGDLASAVRETAKALRLCPGHLEHRYWRGRTLLACGRRHEGETILHDLMTRFPNEHWSRRVRAEAGQRAAGTAEIGVGALDSPGGAA